MAKLGLLGLDEMDEDQQMALRSGLLMGGLQMMMPVRGGRGKFAPQFAQGAMQGVGAYDAKLGQLRHDRAAREAERQRRAAAEALANIDMQEEQEFQSPTYNPMDGGTKSYGLLNAGSGIQGFEPEQPYRPQPYGLLNARGRAINQADLDRDQLEQMALQGASFEDINNSADIEQESINHQESLNPVETAAPLGTYPLDENNNVTLPPIEVLGDRRRQTEPLPVSIPSQRNNIPPIVQTPQGINPNAAPVRVGNQQQGRSWGERYRIAQQAMVAGVPGAKEMITSLIEERKRKTQVVKGALVDESTGNVLYKAPDELKQIDLGDKWGFVNDSGEVVRTSPKSLSPNDAARLEQDQLQFGARLDADKLKNERTFATDQFKNANTLRDEYNNQSKTFATIAQAHRQVVESGNNPSPAGDLSLLYGYMKALDPGSVVRESEFALAAQAGSLDQRVQGWAEKILSGQRLTAEQRADFIGRSQRLYESAIVDHSKLTERYRGIAERNGVPVADILGDFSTEAKRNDSGELAKLRKPPPPSGVINGYNIADTISEANRVIRSGGNPEGIRKKLEKYGFSKSILDEHLDAR